jgi:hypothetical protein
MKAKTILFFVTLLLASLGWGQQVATYVTSSCTGDGQNTAKLAVTDHCSVSNINIFPSETWYVTEHDVGGIINTAFCNNGSGHRPLEIDEADTNTCVCTAFRSGSDTAVATGNCNQVSGWYKQNTSCTF